jgi:hypothetical protein
MIYESTPFHLEDQVKNQFFSREREFELSLSCQDSISHTFDEIKHFDKDYMNHETIEFFKNHNLRIRIYNSFDLIHLL